MIFAALPMMFVAMEAGAIAAANSTFIGPPAPPTRWARFKDGLTLWFVVSLMLLEAAVIVGAFVGLCYLFGVIWRAQP